MCYAYNEEQLIKTSKIPISLPTYSSSGSHMARAYPGSLERKAGTKPRQDTSQSQSRSPAPALILRQCGHTIYITCTSLRHRKELECLGKAHRHGEELQTPHRQGSQMAAFFCLFLFCFSSLM